MQVSWGGRTLSRRTTPLSEWHREEGGGRGSGYQCATWLPGARGQVSQIAKSTGHDRRRGQPEQRARAHRSECTNSLGSQRETVAISFSFISEARVEAPGSFGFTRAWQSTRWIGIIMQRKRVRLFENWSSMLFYDHLSKLSVIRQEPSCANIPAVASASNVAVGLRVVSSAPKLWSQRSAC